jgi:hypothetical protein
MTKWKSVVLAAVAAAATSVSSRADALAYDNFTTPQTTNTTQILRTDGANMEIGDEINLIGGANTVTRFQFDYVYTGGAGAVGVLRFYNLDAPDLAPGHAGLFMPGSVVPGSENFLPFNLQNGHIQADTGPISIAVPGRFVFAVEFQNVGSGFAAGFDLYNDVTVGSGPGQSEDDHWGRTPAGSWTLFNDVFGIDNFGARVTVVPEPGTIALLAAGSLALVGVARRRKA